MTLLFLLLGCAVDIEFIGDDIDDFDAGGSPLESGQDPDDARSSQLLLVGGVGEIAATHDAVVDRCCAEWEITTAGAGDALIEATYTDVAEATCDDTCEWALTYVIADVPAGVWTVTARGDQATVTVQ